MLGEKYIEVRGKKEKKKYRFSECTKLYLPSTHVLKKGRGRKKKKKKKVDTSRITECFPYLVLHTAMDHGS